MPQDKIITDDLTVHNLHEKLQIGVDNIETILVYRQIPGHPDPGEAFDDQVLHARPLRPDQLPAGDARLVDAGMKRGLEDPTPNERVTNKSKIFGMWRADDLTELGDCKSA